MNNLKNRNYILESPSLTLDILDKIFSGKVLVVRIPNFCSKKLAENLTTWALANEKRTKYLNDIIVDGTVQYIDYGVDRIGPAYNKTFNTSSLSEEHEKYNKEINETMEAIREVCSPETPPIEKFRNLVREIWPEGERRALFEGTEAMSGIIRITNPVGELLEKDIHVDRPPESLGLIDELSANVYLSLPEKGGEFMLWPVTPFRDSGYKNTDDYAAWAASKENPIILKPRVGELFIFNTGRAHCVSSFTSGIRTSTQTFVGYKKGEPIIFWN